jgi:glycosyltransferase involved in cell wall biosynthesis
VRVVFLSPSGELGGAETALLDMLASIREARPEWTLALIAASRGPLVAKAAAYAQSTALPFPATLARLGEWGTGHSDAAAALGAPARGSGVTRLRLGLGAVMAAAPAMSYARRLQRRLLDFQPDIIHSNGLKMHLLSARVRPTGARLIWHLHDYPAPRRLTARLLASQMHRCDMLLANSDSVAADARQRFGDSVPVHAVYNSIDLDRFTPLGPVADLDALAGLPPLSPGGIRVGLIGTFARWKGHTVFLDALARLRGHVNVRGYIVGDSIYHTDASQYSRAQLRARAEACGLGDSVGFTGQVDDVSAVLRGLDVAVHASTEPEPFGLVIAEAMACGRPVVVSRAGGAAEIAQAGAVFHQPGNSMELAERISELARDADRRAALGRDGRAAALRLFSRTRLREALIPIYERLAQTARTNHV